MLVDGQPRLSCTLKPKNVANKEVITLEGLPETVRTQIAESFVSCGGVQCGFCIPGMAMRGHSIVESNPNPTREQIAFELRAHLCRCTGYVKIVDAIEKYASVRRGDGCCQHDGSGRIGTSLARHNGRDLVLGDFRYIDDITIPGSLYAAMKFS